MLICLFMTKVHKRVIRKGLSQLMDGCPQAPKRPIATAVRQLDRAIEQVALKAKIAS